MKLLEPTRIILIIVLVIGGIWLVGYLIDNHYENRDKERRELFQRATEECYGREKSCDAIFEGLYEDLFPESPNIDY